MSCVIPGFGILGGMNGTNVSKAVYDAHEYLKEATIDYWHMRNNFVESASHFQISKLHFEQWCSWIATFQQWLEDTALETRQEIVRLRVKDHRSTIEWDQRKGSRPHDYDYDSILFLENCCLVDERGNEIFNPWSDLLHIIPAFHRLKYDAKAITRKDLQHIASFKNTSEKEDYNWHKLLTPLHCPGYDVGDFVFTLHDYQELVVPHGLRKQVILAWYNLPDSDLSDLISIDLLMVIVAT